MDFSYRPTMSGELKSSNAIYMVIFDGLHPVWMRELKFFLPSEVCHFTTVTSYVDVGIEIALMIPGFRLAINESKCLNREGGDAYG